jgi:large subunit ribosomal protein L6
MSRIGKLPIEIPTGVTITVDHDTIAVTGPKGALSQFTMPGILVSVEDNKAIVTRESDAREHRAKHGLMRTLVNNMVVGVTTGFEKKLEINGVGYKAAIEGRKVKLALGFSHDVYYAMPEDVNVVVEANVMTITGINKQHVGQTAAELRALKKPEPYKGKGIKYSDERIIRKSGKSGKDK